MTMPNYERMQVPLIYLNDFMHLGRFIRENYDEKTKSHLVRIEDGSISVIKKDGRAHKVLEDVTISIRKDLPKDKREELDRILND